LKAAWTGSGGMLEDRTKSFHLWIAELQTEEASGEVVSMVIENDGVHCFTHLEELEMDSPRITVAVIAKARSPVLMSMLALDLDSSRRAIMIVILSVHHVVLQMYWATFVSNVEVCFRKGCQSCQNTVW